jgi:hypothetical protein
MEVQLPLDKFMEKIKSEFQKHIDNHYTKDKKTRSGLKLLLETFFFFVIFIIIIKILIIFL